MHPTLFFKFVIIVFFSVVSNVSAHNKAIVVPIFSDSSLPLSQIITVAKANGQFNDPIQAMESIKDASADKPYLVAIAPGTYSLKSTLAVKPFVSVIGSGRKLTTLVNATAPGNNVAPSRTVFLDGQTFSNDAVISNLTIINERRGNQDSCLALDEGMASVVDIIDVDLIARDCAEINLGLLLMGSQATRELRGIDISVRGGNHATGIQFSLGGQYNLDRINISASLALSQSAGIIMVPASSLRLKNSSITVDSFTGSQIGVDTNMLSGGKSISIENSSISVGVGSRLDNSDAVGVLITEGSQGTFEIVRSSIRSYTNAIATSTPSPIYVTQSTLVGEVSRGAATSGPIKCIASDNGSGLELESDCSVGSASTR